MTDRSSPGLESPLLDLGWYLGGIWALELALRQPNQIETGAIMPTQ
ncbi:MAG: hypothetical protein ACFB12_09660 [Leptolyngbyaceae cyanobacterium]